MKKSMQTRLFELVKKKIPENQNDVNVIANDLDLSRSSVYRLLNEETDIKLKYVSILIEKHQIPLDELFGKNINQITFNDFSLSLDSVDNYVNELKRLYSMMQSFPISEDTNWMIASDYIPMFHLINFPALSYFNMYIRYRNTKLNPKSYEEFVSRLPHLEIRDSHKALFDLFKKVNTEEIISQTGILNYRELVEEAWKEGAFDKEESLEEIKEALMQMIDQLNKWCMEGNKDGQGTFKVYYSTLDTCLNSLMSTQDDQPEFVMTLALGQKVMIAEDRDKINNATQQFKSLKKRKICLCGLGASNRNKKFNFLKREISTIGRNDSARYNS